jgi:hypothetical protein
VTRGFKPRRVVRAFALLGATVLSLSVTTSALAIWPPGNVTVNADGCSFTVHIDLDTSSDLIGWKINEFNETHWNDWDNAKTVFAGEGPTDGNGVVDLGPFTAPSGHYNVIVDDENPPDASSNVVDFTLSCPQSPPAPTGGEQGAHGTPGITPPPTNTTAPNETTGTGGLTPFLLAIVALSAVILLATPRRALARVRRNRR